MAKPLVWIVGDAAHSDFRPAWTWLQDHAHVEQCFAPVPGACGPQAVLFVSCRPGQISQETVERFHRAVPLARLVALVGVFCEGELRSSRVCQGVTRIYWHQWAERLSRELGLVEGASPWRPRSQTDADDLLLDLGPALRHRPQSELVAICTSDRSEYETLADVCSISGRRSVWQEPTEPPHSRGADVLVVDGWRSISALSQFRADVAHHQPPVILLADFPRPESASDLSIARILARPLSIADLFAALGALAIRPAESHRSRSVA